MLETAKCTVLISRLPFGSDKLDVWLKKRDRKRFHSNHVNAIGKL